MTRAETLIARGMLAGIATWSVCVTAQTSQLSMPGQPMEMVDQTPPEHLPAPRKLSGIGNAHIPITGSRDVQAWFDQGLNLYHDFWDYESARAFQQAIRLDPQCAMCYWGLGKAEAFYHSNSPDYAKPAFEKASSLIERVSDRERLYIRATMADSRSAVDVWRTLVQRYPDDAEAQLFLAQASGGPEYLATLQSILKVDPNNSAANHAYIHAREGSAHPEEALRSAEVLATLAPASGHMVHMPGHIYFRLGDYARAEQAFAASERVDERYLREQHVDPDNDWNYVHNLMYAIANFLEEGKFQAAITSSMKLNGARGVLESTLYVYSTRDSMSRLEPRLPVALRTANWQQVLDLLNASRVPDDRPHLALLAAQLRSFATGMKAIEGRDVRAASEASASLDAALRNPQPNRPTVAQMPTTPITPPKMAVRPDALLPPILSVLSIMASELRGAVLLAQGRRSEAAQTFDQASKAEQDLGYREPPIYIRPVAESYAAALVDAGDFAAARQAYQQAIDQRPHSGFGLYGTALCAEKTGDINRAVADYRAFLDAWKGADRALPQVVHARGYVSTHHTGASN